MKRFMDIGHQYYCTNKYPKQFAFYCTIVDSFERFNGEDLWETANEFQEDYLADGGNNIKRYLALIPNEFKKELKK